MWLSEIMLQQTTVTAVKPYFAAFLGRFPTVAALAAAPSEAVMSAWAGLGYYSRARNLHACAHAVMGQHGGHFPDTEAGLRALPGIGAYTAGAVAAIAFDRPSAAVDGNVERVVSRLFALAEPLPAVRPRIREATERLVPARRPGDFAQALMDLGATICTPKRPACALCPWMEPCRARAAGLQESFPVKAAKREGVLRRGAAFVAIRDDDALLLRTRDPKGLLGGMAEVPTSAWSADYDLAKGVLDAPLEARWRHRDGLVRHVFTHFPLELAVFVARVAAGVPPPEGARWTPRRTLTAEPLPNLIEEGVGPRTGGAGRERWREAGGAGPVRLGPRRPDVPGSRLCVHHGRVFPLSVGDPMTTDLLERAIRVAQAMSPEMQDDLAQMVLTYAGEEPAAFALTAEDEAAITRSRAQSASRRVRERRGDPRHLGEAWPVKVRYTPGAAGELAAVLDYIAERSPQGARNVHARMGAAERLLSRFPGIGQRGPVALAAPDRGAALPVPDLLRGSRERGLDPPHPSRQPRPRRQLSGATNRSGARGAAAWARIGSGLNRFSGANRPVGLKS